MLNDAELAELGRISRLPERERNIALTAMEEDRLGTRRHLIGGPLVETRDAAFDEAEHPRDKDGKFTTGGGGGGDEDRTSATGIEEKKAPPKNPMSKSRKVDDPYLTIEDMGGQWVTKVLKAYQSDPNKPYARWFCAVSSPYTGGGYDMGDTYVSEVQGTITQRDPVVTDEALPRHLLGGTKAPGEPGMKALFGDEYADQRDTPEHDPNTYK